MKILVLATCLSLPPALAQGTEKPVKMAAVDKILVLEVTVPAPIGEVWKAFSTSEGLSTWLTPSAVVDLREGGEWTGSFSRWKHGRRDNFELCPGERAGVVGVGSG